MGIPLPREREFERGILVWIWDRRDVWVGLKPTERLQASRGRRQGRRTRRTKTLSEVNGEVRLKKRLTQPTLLEISGNACACAALRQIGVGLLGFAQKLLTLRRHQISTKRTLDIRVARRPAA